MAPIAVVEQANGEWEQSAHLGPSESGFHPGKHFPIALGRHRELRTGLRPTRVDETDFAGASGLALLLGLPARGRSLSDAVELARELDPERFDDLVLGMERRRS